MKRRHTGLFPLLLATAALATATAPDSEPAPGALVPILPGKGLHYIGSQRQLFFDDYVVETTEHTRRRLNPAVKVTPNPILPRDRPWEGSDTRGAWIFFDHRLGKFRMRYTTGNYVAAGRDAKGQVIVKNEPEKSLICEAFSDDGIHWDKPNLGLVEFNGSKANNIVPPSMHYAYFFEDTHDPDPRRHYKAQVRTGEMDQVGMQFAYYYSPDGYAWTPYAHNPIIDTGHHRGRWGPTDFIGWDPIRQVYAVQMENNYHMNSPYWRRSIGRAESPDMIHWSEPETIVVADDRDYPDVEFYSMPTAFYAGWEIGFLWNFSTTNTTFTPQFVFSRDGFLYNRDYRDAIIPRGDPGAFDSVAVYAGRPIFHGDKIYCYYTGTNWRSPEELLQLGDKAGAGIGLALLPRDGFVSLEGARHDFSVVTTRAFTFSGRGLYLNLYAALQGWGAERCVVKVELLDGRLAPIPGFALADADTLSKTAVDQRITWKGRDDVSSLWGRPIRVRIHFKNAKLYAFQFK